MKIPGPWRRDSATLPEEETPAPERCLNCEAQLTESRSYERFRICHSCGHHFHLNALERVAMLLDRGTFHEDDRGVSTLDPIRFRGRKPYETRVIEAQRRTGLSEAVLTGRGTIRGREVVLGILEFSFLGGSLGVAAGERLARAFERAAARRLPIVTVTSTSGTRMREGLVALLQLPRVLAAVRRAEAAGVPHIAVLTDPTTGSAYAGFVNRADFIIGEPHALIGYAPLRQLREHEGSDLPEGAHTAEWHLERGLIDAVVERPALRDQLARCLDVMTPDYDHRPTHEPARDHATHVEIEAIEQLKLSRHSGRPTAREFIAGICTEFVEIHGNRSGVDDPSIVAGLALIGGESLVVVGQQRHIDGEAVRIGAAGFHKARRAMRMAAKFNLPLVTLIDTSGAGVSMSDEAAGTGHALASCAARMLDLPVPTLAVITGEGNSEAAAALAAADRVLMLDNAVYEVVTPETAARVFYSAEERVSEAADRLRITSHDCLKLGVVDDVVPEPGEGAHTNPVEAASLLRRYVLRELSSLKGQRKARRLDARYHRYRDVGSTRSSVRGTAERRLAHFGDRVGGFLGRFRGRRSSNDYPTSDIPL